MDCMYLKIPYAVPEMYLNAGDRIKIFILQIWEFILEPPVWQPKD